MNQEERAIIRGEAGEASRILANFIQEQEEGFYGANPTPRKAINIRKKYIEQIETLAQESYKVGYTAGNLQREES